MSGLLQEVRIYFDPTIPTICTVPYNMTQDEKAMNMNERVRHINVVIRDIRGKSILPLRFLDVAWMMETSLPGDFPSDGIQFDRSKGVELLNNVFLRHINSLESSVYPLPGA